MAQENKAQVAPKGYEMEERLRSYFLNLGYYVLRGVKFKHNQFDVTDVDLWLYSRPSPVFRERCNVDVKNKKTPQALERVFWAKGIQQVLGLERCIVATTDSRPDVAAFGLSHQVTVLDGAFLSRLEKSDRSTPNRLSEEELLDLFERATLGKIAGDWRGGYEKGKARVLTSLDFDGANLWLQEILQLLDIHLSGPVEGDAALRLCYANIGMLLVAIDFLTRPCINMSHEQRYHYLTDGFRYGSSGKTASEGIVRVASRLVSATSGKNSQMVAIENELFHQFSGIRAEILAEYVAKAGIQGTLVETAREFESAAYSPTSPFPAEMSVQAQSFLGTLSDYLERDRKQVLRERFK